MTLRVPDNELESALNQVLGHLGCPATDLHHGVGTRRRARPDTFYEAYVFALVVEVLAGLGFGPHVDTRTRVSRKFAVRRVHGEVRDDAYSYVTFQTQGRQRSRTYELHLDTYYRPNRGGGKLEVDVSITTRSEADRARYGRIERPSHRTLHLLLEAKHYSETASTAPATSYLGRSRKLHVRGRPEGLVLSGSISQGAKVLVSSDGLHVYERLTPLRADRLSVQEFQSDLRQSLATL